MKLCMPASLALFTLATAAIASPLKPEWVASDAEWVIHVDLDAAHASSVGKAVLTQIESAIDASEEFEAKMILAMAKQVKGVTLYGVEESDEEGVVIVTATKDLDEAIQALPGLTKNYQKVIEDSRTIHSFEADDDETWFIYQRPDTDPNRRVLLVAQKLERLMHGISAMEAGKPGAALAKPLQGAGPRAGAVFFVSASAIPGIEEEGAASAVFRGATSLRAEAGEAAGQVFAEARLDTGNVENALNAAQVAQGLMALGRIAASSDPMLKPGIDILQNVKIGSQGQIVTMDFTYDAEQLTEMAENFLEIAAKLDDGGHEEHDEDDRHVKVRVKSKKSAVEEEGEGDDAEAQPAKSKGTNNQ